MASDRQLRISFTGKDETGQSVKSVTASLKELKSAIREGREDISKERQAYSDSLRVLRERVREERNLQLEIRQSHEGFFKTVNAMQTVGNVALKVNQLFVNHNLLQQRIKDNNDDLKDSFIKLQDAIATHGKGSYEAELAQREFNDAKERSSALNREEIVQYGFMGLALAGISGDIANMTTRLVAWRRARATAFDPIDGKSTTGGLADETNRITGTGKGGGSGLDVTTGKTYNQADIDAFRARFMQGSKGSGAIDSALVNQRYNELFGKQAVKPPNPTTGTSIFDPEFAGKGGGLASRVSGGFGRIGGNEIAAIASIVAPIALANADFDKWMEDTFKVNVSRASEDREIYEKYGMGVPEEYLYMKNEKGEYLKEDEAKQAFYNDYYNTYDKKLAGEVNINVYVNNTNDGQEVGEKTAEAVSKYAQMWSSQWG